MIRQLAFCQPCGLPFAGSQNKLYVIDLKSFAVSTDRPLPSPIVGAKVSNIALWASLGVEVRLRFRTRYCFADSFRSVLQLLSKLATALLIVRDHPIAIGVTNKQFVDGGFRRIEFVVVAPKERVYLKLQ